MQIEAHAIERTYAGKRLRDVRHLEKKWRGHDITLPLDRLTLLRRDLRPLIMRNIPVHVLFAQESVLDHGLGDVRFVHRDGL